MAELHSLSASQIASLSIGTSNPRNLLNQQYQTQHRIALIKAWSIIKPGHRVLELGCGQGDMTAVLATIVGDGGKVVAVDPADAANYGAPYTLKQAQDHLLASEIGKRITFIEGDPLNLIEETKESFDIVVLAQCLWYFSTPAIIVDTFRTIKTHLPNALVCVAEFALRSRFAEAMPHIHAVLTMAALEVCKPVSTSNVRTILSPAGLKAVIQEAGWSVVEGKEGYVTPDTTYQDARWEVGAVLDGNFLKEIEENVNDARQKAAIVALRDTVLMHAEIVPSMERRSMDVWTSVWGA